MTTYKRPESVLVVIHTRDQVLLMERADHPGWWQSVTGSLEANESPVQAAIRETAEETGLDATEYRLSDWQRSYAYEIYAEFRHRYAPEVTHNTEHVFSLLLPHQKKITLAPREHLRYSWHSMPEAAAQCFSPSNRRAIEQLQKALP